VHVTILIQAVEQPSGTQAAVAEAPCAAAAPAAGVGRGPKPEPPERALPTYAFSTVALLAHLSKWSYKSNNAQGCEASMARWGALLSSLLSTWLPLPVSFAIFGQCPDISPNIAFHGRIPGRFAIDVEGHATITFDDPSHATAQRILKLVGSEKLVASTMQQILRLDKKDFCIARQILCKLASLVEATGNSCFDCLCGLGLLTLALGIRAHTLFRIFCREIVSDVCVCVGFVCFCMRSGWLA
jgi:hypothetical protein